MRIIRPRPKWPFYLLAVIVLLGGYTYWALTQPLPPLQPQKAHRTVALAAPGSKLTWPAAGQSAVGLPAENVLETHGDQKPVPIASVAKIITCLVVLEQKPLSNGQTGPVITLGAADVALYKNTMAQDGSLVPVVAGEQINQYQMLQAIMLPSANNMADSLAVWAFGSLPAYSAAANSWLAKNGLKSTTVGSDASGLSPATTSTASDLVKLGELAMKNPVLAEIVGQSQANGIPQTATVKNVNSLLGTNGIVGVKTGNTDQAGGVFVSASQVMIDNKPVTIITAVAGQPTLFVALKDSLALVRSAQVNFSHVTVFKAGQTVGSYHLPWDGTIPAVTSSDLKTTTWNGSPTKATVSLRTIPAEQTDVGIAAAGSQSVNIKLDHSKPLPSAWWRLTHPF